MSSTMDLELKRSVFLQLVMILLTGKKNFTPPIYYISLVNCCIYPKYLDTFTP